MRVDELVMDFLPIKLFCTLFYAFMSSMMKNFLIVIQ